MTVDVADAYAAEKPPRRIGPLVAVALELSMLAVFVHGREWIGVALWVAYLWFSATWALLRGAFDSPS